MVGLLLKAGRTGMRPVAPCAKGGDVDGRYHGRAGCAAPDDHEVRLSGRGEAGTQVPRPPAVVEEAGLAFPALVVVEAGIPPSGDRWGVAVRLAGAKVAPPR